MIVITGRMTIADDKRSAFLGIATRQVELSKLEAGCINYWLFEDAHHPGIFFFYEEWKDRAAVDFHFAQDYCLDFVKKLRPLTTGEADMNIRTIAEKPTKPDA